MKGKFQQRRVGNLDIVELPGDPAKGTIVLLHGFGADAYDLASLSGVYKGPTWIFPQGPLPVPIAPGYIGNAWFPVNIELLAQAIREKRYDEISEAFPAELGYARTLLEDFLIELNIPRSHLILGGFSQGAVLAVEIALHSMQKCAALLIFSGTLINHVNWKKLAPLHAHTHFFQSHGSQDPLLPLEKAVELERLLLNGGLTGKLHSFQGGHEIPHSVLLELSTFLSKLNKD